MPSTEPLQLRPSSPTRQPTVAYDPRTVTAFFDELGEGEWQRHDKDGCAAVQEHIHNVYLTRFVQPGSHVLEIGSGPGRFTRTLASLGCSAYKTYQTCNAQPACMWGGLPNSCMKRVE